MTKSLSPRLPGPWQDAGLLFLRAGTGLMMFIHGLPKLMGGVAAWERIGAGIPHVVGIHFWPVFWGLLIAVIQGIGGVLIALGILTRTSALALGILLLLATIMTLQAPGSTFSAYSHPLEGAITCLGIFLLGPGRFTLPRLLRR